MPVLHPVSCAAPPQLQDYQNSAEGSSPGSQGVLTQKLEITEEQTPCSESQRLEEFHVFSVV